MASLCKMMMIMPKNLLRVIGSSTPHHQSSVGSIFVRYKSDGKPPKKPTIRTNPPQHNSIKPSSSSTDQIRDVSTSNIRSSAGDLDLGGGAIIGGQNIATTANTAQAVAN